VPGLVVSKIFQLEHRLDVLVDLKIASESRSLGMKGSSQRNQPGKPN
jgi:hypothetical protein